MLQGVQFGREGVKQLLESLCEVAGLDKSRTARKMDAFWGQLENKIGEVAMSRTGPAKHVQKRSTDDKVDEILTTVRDLRVDMDRERMYRTERERTRERLREAHRREAGEVSDARQLTEELARSVSRARTRRDTSEYNVTEEAAMMLREHGLPITGAIYAPETGTLTVSLDFQPPQKLINSAAAELARSLNISWVDWEYPEND